MGVERLRYAHRGVLHAQVHRFAHMGSPLDAGASSRTDASSAARRLDVRSARDCPADAAKGGLSPALVHRNRTYSLSCIGAGNCVGSGTNSDCPTGSACRDLPGDALAYSFNPDSCAGQCGQIDWNPACDSPVGGCQIACPNTCPGNQVCVGTYQGSLLTNGVCCQPATCQSSNATVATLSRGVASLPRCSAVPARRGKCAMAIRAGTPTTCAAHGAALDNFAWLRRHSSCGSRPAPRNVPRTSVGTPTTPRRPGARSRLLSDGSAVRLLAARGPSG